MIPGKQYTPELILQIAWRRKWIIGVPAVAVAVGVAGWTQRLTDMYRSDTTILVVPQRISEEYVRSTVTARIEDRLASITQQIMSRTRLERIIQDFELYAEDRKTEIMEDIVEQMRDDVDIQPIRGDAFRVSYRSEDARTAMRVTERLASLFIDESLRDREVLAEGTNLFLEAQLEDARRQLIDNEKKLEEYRRRHDGQLPAQHEANLQGVHNTEMQIQALIESLNRDHDRRALLDRAIADANAADTSGTPSSPAGDPQSPAGQLRAAEEALTALRLRVTPQHPDVVRLERVIAELQQRVEEEAAARPVSADVKTLPPAERIRQSRIEDMSSQIVDLDKQIAYKTEQEKRLRQVLATYQARIEATPTRESEMADLMRDYSTFQASYQSLLGKKQASQISANLERRQIGEQFRILDPARLPQRPYSPNRPWFYTLGIVSGIAIGLGLAGVLEYLDRTMRSEDDVRTALNLPVLAAIPLVMNPVTARRRRRWVAASVSACVVLAAAAVVAWRFLG